MINLEFKTANDLLKSFSNEEICINHLEKLRWNGNIISPFDSKSKVYECAGNKYKCKNTGKYFNVRTSTMFDSTKIELQTWFIAIFLITQYNPKISSVELARSLGITHKTALIMYRRIKNCFGI